MEFALVFIALYMIPGIIALGRQHNNKVAIIALNILVGWTFLGWVAAFVWSLTSNTRNRTQNVVQHVQVHYVPVPPPPPIPNYRQIDHLAIDAVRRELD